MSPLRFLLITVLLAGMSYGTRAQDVFVQQEGKFLYPPNLTIQSDSLLLGMTIGSLPGFPITATIDSENIRYVAQGKTVTARFRSRIYRDSKGRTRLEWDLTPLDDPPKPGWFMIEIYDPTTRTGLHLQPSTKT